MSNQQLWDAVEKGDLLKTKDLIDCGYDVNYFHQFTERSLLHKAVVHGHYDIFQLLLQQPDIMLDRRDVVQETPFHKACLFGQMQMTQTLIENNIDTNAVNNNGNSGLHLAVLQSHAEVVELLLKQNVEEVKNKDGKTARDFARDEKKCFKMFEIHRAVVEVESEGTVESAFDENSDTVPEKDSEKKSTNGSELEEEIGGSDLSEED